ncbi:acetylxylan esterase [Bacillus kwashiorkori]|uniref:acetylxylan esterase n=1 Tax=Bacillus kwashiorkori TaxID=1522318 RepID=UPI000782BDD4|nr:acetylxylan esterase [Bacillus kwashiorkori]
MNLYDFPLDELYQYKPKLTKQPDFQTFWNSKISENRKYPLNLHVQELTYPVPGVQVFDVYFDGFRNSRIHGIYIRPNDIRPNVPAAVIFHGYNWNTLQPHYTFKYIIQGIPVLLVEVRGQNVKSSDCNLYDNGGSAGWLTKGILNPDNYYYSLVYMDCYRSIDVVKELTEKEKVFVEGSSQGGALSIAATALHDSVVFSLCDIPFLSNFNRSITLASDGPYSEIYHYYKVHDPLHKTEQIVNNTLSYIDCINLASLITSPVLVTVGLEDPVCPPSSSFALYNHLLGEKEINVYPEYGHETHPMNEEVKLTFVAKHL